MKGFLLGIVGLVIVGGCGGIDWFEDLTPVRDESKKGASGVCFMKLAFTSGASCTAGTAGVVKSGPVPISACVIGEPSGEVEPALWVAGNGPYEPVLRQGGGRVFYFGHFHVDASMGGVLLHVDDLGEDESRACVANGAGTWVE